MDTMYTIFDSRTDRTKLPDIYILDLILLSDTINDDGESLEALSQVFRIDIEDLEDFFNDAFGKSSADAWLHALQLEPEDEPDANHVYRMAIANLFMARSLGVTYSQAASTAAIAHEWATGNPEATPEDLGADNEHDARLSLGAYSRYKTIVEAWMARPHLNQTNDIVGVV